MSLTFSGSNREILVRSLTTAMRRHGCTELMDPPSNHLYPMPAGKKLATIKLFKVEKDTKLEKIIELMLAKNLRPAITPEAYAILASIVRW